MLGILLVAWALQFTLAGQLVIIQSKGVSPGGIQVRAHVRPRLKAVSSSVKGVTRGKNIKVVTLSPL